MKFVCHRRRHRSCRCRPRIQNPRSTKRTTTKSFDKTHEMVFPSDFDGTVGVVAFAVAVVVRRRDFFFFSWQFDPRRNVQMNERNGCVCVHWNNPL